MLSRIVTRHFVLKSSDGRYFQSTPARPHLTIRRELAREFDSEVLANAFRETVEITAKLSFEVCPVVARFQSSGVCR